MARLEPVPDGLRLLLEADEVAVLTQLASGLATRLRGHLAGIPSDPVIDRLAPEVSRGDAVVDRELRAMLRPELLDTRAERLDGFVSLLHAWVDLTGALDRPLERDEAMQVVEALNDLRLALWASMAEERELREAADTAQPSDAAAEAAQLIDALAWLQGGLIEFIDGGS
jgi:hypothetical protein